MDQITAVMALKVRGRHYADNIGRCDILFQSFCHFGLVDLFSEILIVIPGAEEEYIRAHARSWDRLPIRFVVEDEYLEKFKEFSRPHEVRNWHRQQIIKLFCAQLIKTDFFLVLDPDVFAVKPFRFDDIIVDNKAIVENDQRRWHADWWQSSAALLGVEPHLERPGIGVTPALLSRDACLGLTRFLTERHRKNWYEVLLSHYTTQWTEYTLYQLYLEHVGEFEKFHVDPSTLHSIVRLHSPAPWGVWKPGQYQRLNVAQLFSAENPGLFSVVQSNVGVTPQQIARDFNDYLPLRIQDYAHQSNPLDRAREVYGALARRSIQLLRRFR